jgi:hypothetical protein
MRRSCQSAHLLVAAGEAADRPGAVHPAYVEGGDQRVAHRSPATRLGDDAGIPGAALTVVEQTLSPEQVDSWFTELAGA